jgi:hypothetical protein
MKQIVAVTVSVVYTFAIWCRTCAQQCIHYNQCISAHKRRCTATITLADTAVHCEYAAAATTAVTPLQST